MICYTRAYEGTTAGRADAHLAVYLSEWGVKLKGRGRKGQGVKRGSLKGGGGKWRGYRRWECNLER